MNKQFRDAGELLFLIRKELGFGEVTLSSEIGNHSFKFEWFARIAGKLYTIDWVVSFIDLHYRNSLEWIAKDVASQMKEKVVEKHGAPI